MKYVLLSIFILFAAQPSQAVCHMDDGQEAPHSQHGAMSDGPMNHGEDGGMDCCDDEPANKQDGCDMMSHCGAAPVGFMAISPATFPATYNSGPLRFLLATAAPPNTFISPPFRPPIS